MKAYITHMPGLQALEAFTAFHDLDFSLFLDSADTRHPAGRYSYILWNPVKIFKNHSKKNIFKDLQSDLVSFYSTYKPVDGLPPFQGGLAGVLTYDLDVMIGLYDQILAFDETTKEAWLIIHAQDENEAEIKKREAFRILENQRPPESFAPLTLDWKSNFDAFKYKNKIQKVIEYIKAGDIFQANIAQCFSAPLPSNFSPWAHYASLRAFNPAPFSAYFNTGDLKIVSASPERFLSIVNNHVLTQPIKGTRPRVDDPVRDKVYKQELTRSEKDRAENVMIVDLMRNDLSKVCEEDSIKVTKLCALETFASVHHLVSSVEGNLMPSQTPLDLLESCFPGGSITGAPKIRAMEIIEEIENTPRGPYCGSIVTIGFDGFLESSILIRTLVYQNQTVSFHVGSGIVADSKPDEEYQETFDKAEAIFRSFEDYAYEADANYQNIMIGAE